MGGDSFVAANVGMEKFNNGDFTLARKLLYFEDIITRSASDFSTHHLTHYLLDLASGFSRWYGENHVQGEEEDLKNARLLLVRAVGNVLGNGLGLLGIEAPEKM